MDWFSSSNPFEDNRDRYGYGSSGNDYGEGRYGYENGSSAGYGAPASHPRAFVEYEYGYEEAPPVYRSERSEESSPRAVDSPPSFDRFREYEPALAPAYDWNKNYAEQPVFGSRYEEEVSYGSGYNDYGGVRYGGESESRVRTYSYSKETVSEMEPSFVADAEVTEATEEVLVSLRGAQVHLVDDQESPLLGEGEFAVVLIEEAGNGIVTFVRVGENLRWPLTKDEPAVKLDSRHYFFTISVPRPVDEMDTETARCPSQEVMSYGVTFPAAGQEEHLCELDAVLNQYSQFSNPQLVYAEPEGGESYDGAFGHSRLSYTPMDAPREFVTINKLETTKQKEGSEFWEVMAPNVGDYNSEVAKTLAAGTGHLIRGLFWLRDTTVSNLESGSAYVRDKVEPNPRKPSTISPATINNLRRVRNLSLATEQVANLVLNGAVKVAGFFTGAFMRSEAGRRIFKLVPGEVAMVSMDSFAKVFDAVEKTGKDVLRTASAFTKDVVSHRFGEEAGEVTGTSLSTAGHLFSTAWTVTKVRSAWDPLHFKPTTLGAIRAAANTVVDGKGYKFYGD